MSKTVDVVIVAGHSSAAIDAARRGMRVLVVIGSTRVPLIRRLRRALRAAGARVRRGVTVSRCEAIFVKDRPPEFDIENHPATASC